MQSLILKTEGKERWDFETRIIILGTSFTHTGHSKPKRENKGSKVPKPIITYFELLEEGIDDEGDYNVVDDHNPNHVERKEEPSYPFASGNVFEADLTLCPIIHNQEVEQYIHSTNHIIKVVRPVFIIDKVTSSKQHRREWVGGISSNHFPFQRHRKYG